MANRFWVGGGASTNWSATGNTNWATSSGGANNASVPGSGDVAIFDSNSGTSNSVIDTAFTIQGLDCTGGTGNYAGTITHNTSITLTINTGASNSLRFVAGMTYTPATTTSLVTFTNTSGTAVLTSAGQKFATLTVNAPGGTVQLADALNVAAQTNSILTITAGIFDAATNTAAITVGNLIGGGSTARSVLLGGTVTLGINVTGNQNIWSFTTITNLTFTINSANIVVSSGPNVSGNLNFIGGGLTYNTLTLNATSLKSTLTITGANTFSNWSIGAGWILLLGGAQTVSNAFTLTGTPTNPVGLVATTSIISVSVPSGTCTVTWGVLVGITGSGGATFTATNTLASGTIGWVVSPPSDGTSAGIASSVWTDLLSSSDFATASSVGALMKALQNLQYTVPSIGRGTVTTGASTTSIPTSAYSPAPSASIASQLNGHIVIFDANTTTVALRGQVTKIAASSASATPTLTVGALTATPASGDTFSVI